MFLFILCLPRATDATGLLDHSLCVVVADESETTRQIIEKLQKKLPTSQVVKSKHLACTKKQNHIYITIGPAALRSLLEKTEDNPILSLFTSSQSYRTILEKVAKHRRNTVTAIFAEPSPSDQLQLISLLYKRDISVAILLSEKNSYLLPLIKTSAAHLNIDLSVEEVLSEKDINLALNRIANASIILAIPDNNIYNAQNIRNILMTTYRHNQAVIGFSSAMVKAGALASTYSDIDDVLTQADNLLNTAAITGHLPEPQFPKYFSVVINDNVARSLNLVIDDSVRTFKRKPGTGTR